MSDLTQLNGGFSNTWGGCRDKEEWADVHGYVRIHCKFHGQSWSDGGICKACFLMDASMMTKKKRKKIVDIGRESTILNLEVT